MRKVTSGACNTKLFVCLFFKYNFFLPQTNDKILILLLGDKVLIFVP